MKTKLFHRNIGIGRLMFLTIVLLLLAILAVTFLYRPRLLFLLAPAALLLIGVFLFQLLRFHHSLYTAAHHLITYLESQQKQQFSNMQLPSLLISEENEIIWHNPAFLKLFSNQPICGMNFATLFGVSIQSLAQSPQASEEVLTYQSQHLKPYTIVLNAKTSSKRDDSHYLLLLMPVTRLHNASLEYRNSRPAVLIFLLDSYEEIVKDFKESEKTHILSEINRMLEELVANTSGFLLRLNHNRYLAVMEKRHFDEMIAARFPILNDIKEINTSKRVPITLSIGASNCSNTLIENQQNAFLALEMALGRGGDQAAIKTPDNFQFFGGSSTGVEVRNKVKTRIVASAMEELIHGCENVLIMSHKYPDLDAVGSAVGIAHACHVLGKPAKILLDEKKCLAGSLVSHLKNNLETDFFLSHDQAPFWLRRGTLLIVTDVHAKAFLDQFDLYQACEQVVVIDHHRKTVDYIDNALIFYHNPAASSASELVTELLQYFSVDCQLTATHAEALLAGIMLDTKNFIMNTGVRTFEAAAFLRRCGADSLTVRGLFSGSMDDYRNRFSLVSTAEIYQGCAIATTDVPLADARVISAQAADDLLGITDVEASFVIYQENQAQRVIISARSLGKINVQLIMEELGGGGHLTMAAAQLADCTCEQAKNLLISILDIHLKPLQQRLVPPPPVLAVTIPPAETSVSSERV